MAINNITDLTEIQASSLTDNDLIPVGTSTGWKKIKANALGGGGAEDFVAEVSTNDFETFTSTVTVSDLQTAYSAGKNLKAKISTPMGDLWGCLSLATSTAFKFLIFVDSAGLVTCDSSGWALE